MGFRPRRASKTAQSSLFPKWRFQPAMLKGQAVAVRDTVKFTMSIR
jgi:hypothetical protein